MARTNDRSAPERNGATDRSKGTDRDSLGFYAEEAPPGTPVEAIIAAYHSESKASDVDWQEYGGAD